ncbi:MAG: bifunctional nuclease family protein [Planctomycetota bacterium]|jgi:bifunctional DNase/RNase
MDRMVECELARIIINENHSEQYIFLREKEGQRTFPIVIAIIEAMAIDRFVKGETTMRPLTHDLLSNTIRALDANVTRVEVTKLENRTFYANLVLSRNGAEIEIDSRPSDAIAIAVAHSARIFVAENVLEEVRSS